MSSLKSFALELNLDTSFTTSSFDFAVVFLDVLLELESSERLSHQVFAVLGASNFSVAKLPRFGILLDPKLSSPNMP